MTPILVLLFGFHPATAVGTDLIYASVTKSVGTAVHGRRHTVDWKIVAGLACGSVPAAILTLSVMAYFKVGSSHPSFWLNLLLGASLFVTSITVFFRPLILHWAGHHIEAMEQRRVTRSTIVLGAIMGILVSITSVGAGAIGNDRSSDSLSKTAGRAHRRHGHRPRRSIDAYCRDWDWLMGRSTLR